MTPRVEWTAEPPFNADFYFCTFKGENGMDELMPIMADYDAWVEGTEKDSMWYVWHDPLFDTSNASGSVQDGYDYAIGFYWQNNAEREAGYSNYGETDLQSRFDEIEKVRIIVDHDGKIDTLAFMVESNKKYIENLDESIKEIFKLSANIQIVPIESLPKDGKIIDDKRNI